MKDRKWIAGIACFLLECALLFSIIDLCSFDRSFYRYEYNKNQTAESIGMSEEDTMMSTDVLLDYLKGHREDIEATVTVHGEDRSVFNERESLHMVDVRALYNQARLVAWFTAILGFAVLATESRKSKKSFRLILKDGYKTGVLLLMLFVGGISLYALADFRAFWTMFHEVLFDNDLYLLDPRTSIMINLFPESFFFDLVFRIILIFLACTIVFSFLIYGIQRKQNKVKIHIVLYEPEIPANTGNIMRTCVALGLKLHLIEPLGFYMDEKHLRRAGMDYRDRLEMEIHPNWSDFISKNQGEMYFLTRYGKKAPDSCNFRKVQGDLYFVFGRESTGIDHSILRDHLDHCLRIPMRGDARCLNLSNTVAIVAYEAERQLGYPELSFEEVLKGADFLDGQGSKD